MQLYNKYATQDAGFCLPVYIRFQKPPIGASPRFVSQQATGSRLAVFVLGVPMGFIYLIRSGDFHKIGIATDMDARLSSLQTGNPHSLEVILCFEFDDPRPVEKKLHGEFASRSHTGEWFSLDNSDVELVKQRLEWFGGKPVAYERKGRSQIEAGASLSLSLSESRKLRTSDITDPSVSGKSLALPYPEVIGDKWYWTHWILVDDVPRRKVIYGGETKNLSGRIVFPERDGNEHGLV